MNAEERLLSRFEAEFATKGLANVKFFVGANRVSVKELIDEINQFEDTVIAGDVRVVDSIDHGAARTAFDAPFS